jgi:hypothetical protein
MPRTPYFIARLRIAALIASAAVAAGAISSASDDAGPGQPFHVTFTSSANSEFRIQLTVTAHLEGQHTETIGAKTYVSPFTRDAKSILTWRAQTRVIAASADGAEIEETLDGFSSTSAEISADPDAARLAQALNAALSAWSHAAAFRYRETLSGETLGLPAEGAPALDEQSPRVLTAWLLHALRPAAALPARPVILDDHWQDARSVALPNWTGANGWESGQWMAAASGSKFQVRLDDVQQISATVAQGPEKSPDGAAQANFRGESLSTIALDDGRLVAATRSAARTIVWTLTPVAGLPTAPQFSTRLGVEIEIENCDESNCDNLHSELRDSR